MTNPADEGPPPPENPNHDVELFRRDIAAWAKKPQNIVGMSILGLMLVGFLLLNLALEYSGPQHMDEEEREVYVENQQYEEEMRDCMDFNSYWDCVKHGP